MFTFDWRIRQHLKEFNEGKRPTINLMLLVAFILRANVEGQFYPSTETLADDLGVSAPTINKSRKWLYERGTFVKVPYRLRTGKMKDLPARQTVYQLTGYFRNSADQWIPYLYMNPEQSTQMLERVAAVVSESKQSLLLKVKTVNHQQSLPKGISSLLEDIPSSVDKSTGSAPKQKKERARDALVDTITAVLFKAELTDKASVKLAAILAAWIRGQSTGTKSINVGKNEYPSDKPEDVTAFVKWWNAQHDGANPPTSISKFPRWWRQWKQTAKPKQPTFTPDEITPAKSHLDPNDFVVFDDDNSYIGKGMDAQRELERRREERKAAL